MTNALDALVADLSAAGVRTVPFGWILLQYTDTAGHLIAELYQEQLSWVSKPPEKMVRAAIVAHSTLVCGLKS